MRRKVYTDDTPVQDVRLSLRELASVLAGLRAVQMLRSLGSISGQAASDMLDISTCRETIAPLSLEEIDALCERISG